MSKIYAVTMDTFNEGISIRNAYMIARGPFDEKEVAQEEATNAIQDLYEKYKILETEDRQIHMTDISEKEKLLYMQTAEEIIPVARYSIIEIDTNYVTTCKRAGLQTAFKKGTAAQMAEKQKRNKANQYIATMRPKKLNLGVIA